MDNALKTKSVTIYYAIDHHSTGSLPGPGAYDPSKTLTPDGKYYCSKYHDSGSCALRASATRFPDDRFRVPGPGQYNHPIPVNADGRNYVSKFQSSYSRTFGSSQRIFALGGKDGIETTCKLT